MKKQFSFILKVLFFLFLAHTFWTRGKNLPDQLETVMQAVESGGETAAKVVTAKARK